MKPAVPHRIAVMSKALVVLADEKVGILSIVTQRLTIQGENGFRRRAMGCPRMVMKVLIVLLVFYFIGVFGVTAGYFSKSWDSAWSVEYQIAEAVSAATRWPLLIIELLVAK